MREPIAILLVTTDNPLIYSFKSVLARCRKAQVATVIPDNRRITESVTRLPPDIVVIDTIPSQLDIAGQIKNLSPASKVILLTQGVDFISALQSFTVGVRGYLLRSAPIENIVAAIQAVAADKIVTDIDIAMSFAKRYCPPSTRNKQAEGRECLTRRELEILHLIADGYRDRQIATELRLSVRTVKSHVAGVMSKMRVHSRSEAVFVAIRQKLISVDGIVSHST